MSVRGLPRRRAHRAAPSTLLRLVLLVALLAARTASSQPSAAEREAADTPPPVAREFRGVWIASVANIDWPSKPGLSTWQQQGELLDILNRAVDLKLNAVVLQVRPAADALYASRYEPWSEYLTGQMGQAPVPFYDPLTFAVTEAHRRGLELHAWFNPYRARHPSAASTISSNHISKKHPELVRTYGTHLWLDPGERAVQEHSLRVILDVVRRYDIDGVHIDDYFYPYLERNAAGRNISFPDSISYARYRHAGGTLSRENWRRNNVDLFVERLYKGVKRVKPWVKVGISPFGIWRPGSPSSVAGLDAYVELFADSRRWITNGWVDYFSPQLYWPVSAPQQRYPVLLKWWVDQNAHGRHIWPGNYTSRVGAGGASGWRAGELLEQIRLTRAQPGATGNVHFSMQALMGNSEGLADSLRAGAYSAPALVPASPWLDAKRPLEPEAAVHTDTITGGLALTVQSAGKAPWLWVVRTRSGEEWSTTILPGAQRRYTLARDLSSPRPEVVTVSAVGRTGNEGPVITLHPKRQ